AALIAVFVGPGADLQPSADHGHAALGEVAGDKFRGIAPGDNVDEVGLLLAGLAVGAEVPVHRQREGRHGDAAAGPPELRVPGQTAHENDVVQHGMPPYTSTSVMRERITPSVILNTRSSSAGNSG